MTNLLLDLYILVVPQLLWYMFCTIYITRMLEDISSYVRCLFIDYSRAFDTINHELLIRN
jgi:hypothetical protein